MFISFFYPPSPLLTTQKQLQGQRPGSASPIPSPGASRVLPAQLLWSAPFSPCWMTRTLPSSHLKSGKATSCRGICRRKSGFWQRGFPVTIFLFRSQSPSQASWQLQLNGLARRFLEEVGNVVMRALMPISVNLVGFSPDHTAIYAPAQTANNLLGDQLLGPETELAVEGTRRTRAPSKGVFKCKTREDSHLGR